MIDPQKAYEKLIHTLDRNQVEYKLFNHRAALSYQDFAEVQKETGFYGPEGKCLVLKVDDNLIVYITLQGNKVNFDSIKENLKAKKIRLAAPEELKEHFGAEPGCAYPFGFDTQYPIFLDPKIYQVEWFLFSPVLPTKTIQAKGQDLKKVFSSLDNEVEEVTSFNL